jgi:hypothetical protein
MISSVTSGRGRFSYRSGARRSLFDIPRGARFGGGGGGSQDMVSYTNLLPTYITGIQSWATAYLAAAMGMMAAPGNFTAYPSPTYAAQNANELAGIAALALRGSAGATVEADGKSYLRDLYDGLRINTNSKIAAFYAKKIEALLEEFDDSVMPEIQHQHVFSFGGSDHNVAEALASKAMMAKINEIAKMFYDDYIQERQLMHQGLAHATPYGLQCIRDGEMLRQAGAFEREYDQGGLQDAWDHYNEVQMLPIRNLDIAGNAVRTILSTSRTQTSQYHKPSTLSQIAGVAIAGLSIYSMFSGTTMNPYVNTSKGGTQMANPKDPSSMQPYDTLYQ